MKSLIILVAAMFVSANAFAIAFITEEDVQQVLGADKVIEITSTVAQEKLVERDSACFLTLFSRSSRAYVVKKGNDTFLVITEEGLDKLQQCSSL